MDMEVIWSSFFNRVFQIGETAIQNQLVLVETLRDHPRECFKSFTALTIAEAIKRSLPVHGIELSVGRIVRSSDIPRQHSRLYAGLKKLKHDVKKQIILQGTQWQDLGIAILSVARVGYSTPPPAMMNSRVSGTHHRIVTMTELANWFLYAATEVAKLDIYQSQNQFVLELLRSIYDPASAHTATAPQSQSSRQAPLQSLSDYWMAFFNRAYDVGEEALGAGLLTADDVINAEPFLYLGLPGITMLTTIQRSMNGPSDVLVSPSGQPIDVSSVPDDARDFFSAMLQVKKDVLDANLTPDESKSLKLKILWSDAPDKTMPVLENPDREVQLNRITGSLRSVVTDISRQESFKRYFANVVELLAQSAECAED